MTFAVIPTPTTPRIIRVKDGSKHFGAGILIVADAEPTAEEAEAALQANKTALAEADAVQMNLLTAFKQLPIGIQVQFQPVSDAVREAFRAGRTDIAREIITTVALPAELEPSRQALLALIPAE